MPRVKTTANRPKPTHLQKRKKPTTPSAPTEPSTSAPPMPTPPPPAQSPTPAATPSPIAPESERVILRRQELAAGKKKIHYERGFDLSDGEYMKQFVVTQIREWSWETFARQPTVDVPRQLIWDFIANFPAQEEPIFVPVRGVLVDISPATIKEIYGFTYGGTYDWYLSNYANHTIPAIHKTMAEQLTGDPNKQWDREDMLTTELTKEAQVWAKFIRHRLLPNLHMHHLTPRVAVMTYCIQMGLHFFPEKILYNELCESSKNTSGPFYLPSLVKLLCDHAGVPTSPEDTEMIKKPKSAINELCLRRMVEAGTRQKRKGMASFQAETPAAPVKGTISRMEDRVAKLEKINQELVQYIVHSRDRCANAYKELFPEDAFPELTTTLKQAYCNEASSSKPGGSNPDEPVDVDDSFSEDI